MVDFTFSEEQIALQALAKEFAESVLKPIGAEYDLIADPNEALEKFPWHVIKKGSEVGLRTAALPEAHGGANIGILTHLIMLEELLQGDCSLASHFHQNWKLERILAQKCTPEQRDHFLPKFIDDDTALLCVGLSEPDSGCDNMLPYDEPDGGIRTTAVRDGDEWVLNGMKHYIGGGAVGKFFFIATRTDKTVGITQGMTVFVLERETPGFRIGRIHDKMGNRMMMNTELFFENCRVPDFNRLSDVGQGIQFLAAFGAKHVPTTGAFGLAMARAAFEYTVEYAKERVQGGKPIIEHPTVSLRLAEMATLVEAARSISIRAAWHADQPDYDPMIGVLASIFSSDVGPKVCDMAMQVLGGFGYMKACPVERYLRDALMCYHIDGCSDVHRIKIGQMLQGVSRTGYIGR